PDSPWFPQIESAKWWIDLQHVDGRNLDADSYTAAGFTIVSKTTDADGDTLVLGSQRSNKPIEVVVTFRSLDLYCHGFLRAPTAPSALDEVLATCKSIVKH